MRPMDRTSLLHNFKPYFRYLNPSMIIYGTLVGSQSAQGHAGCRTNALSVLTRRSELLTAR